MAYSKVILNGTTLIDLTQKTVTAANMLNGITALKNDGTDITGTYVPASTQSKTATPSTSQQTVSPDPGFLLSSVTVNAMPSGTVGTPSAVKSSVANHSVTVTPSVTNTTGHITGGTLTGTPVSVSASELVSGTLSITDNGTGIDVTNYAAVDVDVSGGGGVDLQDVSIENNDADALYYTDASMTVHSVTSGNRDLYNEPLPVGSLIVSVRTGTAFPGPPISTSGVNLIASYTVGSKGIARIYEVIPRS